MKIERILMCINLKISEAYLFSYCKMHCGINWIFSYRTYFLSTSANYIERVKFTKTNFCSNILYLFICSDVWLFHKNIQYIKNNVNLSCVINLILRFDLYMLFHKLKFILKWDEESIYWHIRLLFAIKSFHWICCFNIR